MIAIAGCGGPKATTQPADSQPTESSTAAPADALDPRDGFDASSIPGRTHWVQAGDTLYSLARDYYGNENQWRKIFYANGKRLADPDRLEVGMKLIIPP